MRTILLLDLLLLAMVPAATGDPVRSVYVVVALCDNESQGIVPVPPALGKGDDARGNLYWGARYGVRTFLSASKQWSLVATPKAHDQKVLERLVFRHKSGTAYLVADAYQGDWIRNAIIRFMQTSAGNTTETVAADGKTIRLGGAGNLVAYVGHNGLMDFSVPEVQKVNQDPGSATIVLACKSKAYFGPALRKLDCRALLLTTNFMAPEAYTLEAALAGWIARERPEQIRERAAKAYNTYQKCGIAGARRLFHAE